MHLILPKTRYNDTKLLRKQYSTRIECRTQNVVYHRLKIQKRIGLVSLVSTLPLIRLTFIIDSHEFVHDARKERRTFVLLNHRQNLARHLLRRSIGSSDLQGGIRGSLDGRLLQTGNALFRRKASEPLANGGGTAIGAPIIGRRFLEEG